MKCVTSFLPVQVVAHHGDLLSQATGIETLEGKIIYKIVLPFAPTQLAETQVYK